MDQERKYTRKFWPVKAAFVILMLLSAVSCKDDNKKGELPTAKDFLEKENPGLFGYGGFLFKYSPENCQISFNRQRRQLRLQNDTQSGYLNIIFEKFPRDGDSESYLEIRYKSAGDEIIHSGSMAILKEDGYNIWLWDQKNKLGVMLPILW